MRIKNLLVFFNKFRDIKEIIRKGIICTATVNLIVLIYFFISKELILIVVMNLLNLFLGVQAATYYILNRYKKNKLAKIQ